MGEDEFIIGYAIIYVCTIVKMIFFFTCTRCDIAILFLGGCVFYRRYLKVMELDRICSEIKKLY
jgi:hypothetical protein